MAARVYRMTFFDSEAPKNWWTFGTFIADYAFSVGIEPPRGRPNINWKYHQMYKQHSTWMDPSTCGCLDEDPTWGYACGILLGPFSDTPMYWIKCIETWDTLGDIPMDDGRIIVSFPWFFPWIGHFPGEFLHFSPRWCTVRCSDRGPRTRHVHLAWLHGGARLNGPSGNPWLAGKSSMDMFQKCLGDFPVTWNATFD